MSGEQDPGAFIGQEPEREADSIPVASSPATSGSRRRLRAGCAWRT